MIERERPSNVTGADFRDLNAGQWPPVKEETADRLRELYLSGGWSFNLNQHESRFSADFAQAHGAAHGIFMANGTVTLEASLTALGVGPGDEVIVPNHTWLATAMAVIYVGAMPVFVDVDPGTLCLDPSSTSAAITPSTKAIIPVHLYGSLADMDAFEDIGRRHDIPIVEDCAQVHGAAWGNRGVGSIGAIGSFSFQQNKLMTAGEGGICITSDPHLADLLYRIKHIGYSVGDPMGKFQDTPPPDVLCHNFRATEFQALILSEQLTELGERTALYSKRAQHLRDRLSRLHGLRMQEEGKKSNPQAYYKAAFVFDQGHLADVPLETIIEAARAAGLPLDPGYGVVYRHPLWNIPPSRYRIASNSHEPVVDRVAILEHRFLGGDTELIDAIGDILEELDGRDWK